MNTQTSAYSWEIWTPTGTLVADLTGIVQSRHFTVTRNRAETITFSIRLETVIDLLTRLNISFSTLFAPGINELRIKRGNRYLLGGKIMYVYPQLTEDISTVEVRVTGFLDLLASRYLYPADTLSYSTDISTVAWAFINTTQSRTNGSFGMTSGTLATSRTLTDTWQPYATSIRDILIAITQRHDTIDMDFSYDKHFNTYYPAMGTDKTELRFSYPGNITSLKLPFDATELANFSINRGSGNGDAQTIETRSDLSSQAVYKLWEKIDDYASVSVAATLDDYGDETLRLFANPTAIPEVTLDGTQEPVLGSYWIGDRVKFDVAAGGPFSVLNNQSWRINQIDVSLGDEDQENITLKVGYA